MSSQPPPSTNSTNVVALDALVLKRGPGRPRKFGRAPTEAERARREHVLARLRQHVARDAAVAATSKPVERKSTVTLDVLMMEIAREVGGLAFDAERAVVEERREAAERISSRRIAALEKIAQLALERARLGLEDNFDPHEPRVQKVIAYFLDAVRECAAETLSPEIAETFLALFEQKSRGWEERVG
jgi:hypothetical protein